jgi:hypothetical protein
MCAALDSRMTAAAALHRESYAQNRFASSYGNKFRLFAT